jgi:beta-glucanase (GH16 family)
MFRHFIRFVPCFVFLAGGLRAAETPWKLVWSDDFQKDNFIDQSKWLRIERGKSDWNRHMSSNPACYAVKDGKLILKGIRNPDPADDVKVITGGVTTRGKFEFCGGKVEIRAKLGAAKGAWPAFWMLSQSKKHGGYPHSGEIDIMERLNHETRIYQTVHSNYTLNLGGSHTPEHHGTTPFDPAVFNTFGLEWFPDKLVFTLNGKPTFTYPKIETDKPGQWPFDQPFYLLLDMQLGGKWVGEIDETQLPVQMEIDWVKVYQPTGKAG